jgi:hypothetical protein
LYFVSDRDLLLGLTVNVSYTCIYELVLPPHEFEAIHPEQTQYVHSKLSPFHGTTRAPFELAFDGGGY